MTTSIFESGRSQDVLATERNAGFFAQQPARRRRVLTPEFFFTRHIDNSRLVKAPDPARVRQMRTFAAAMAVLLSLGMIYGLQHFYAIEIGYRVESEKTTLEQLREQNRQLHLSEAELSQPARIDQKARELGLNAPQPGQVVHPNSAEDAGTPSLAQVQTPAKPAQ